MFYRAVISSADIELLCGVSDRTARKILQDLRATYNKEKGQYITVEEFSYSKGIPVERIYEHFESINELKSPSKQKKVDDEESVDGKKDDEAKEDEAKEDEAEGDEGDD